MESNKVKLPKLAVEAIELLKAKGMPLHEIGLNKATAQLPLVNGWEELLKVPNDVLFQALYYGYEVNQTPEDEIRKYFNNLKASCNWSATGAIENVLEMLNIKIKGVNAE